MQEWWHRALFWGGAGAAIFVAICMLYVLVSFAMLWRSGIELPSVGVRLRLMGRELWLTLLIQPLLPLFYVIGRKMGGGQGQPIVLMHGYFQNRVDFLGMARHLRRRGLGPLYGFNYPWTASTASNVARLARFIDEVRAETGRDSVDLVAHSMGGLIALDYVADEAYTTRIRRCVTIATPHAGVTWRGPILGAASREIRASSTFLLDRKSRRVGVPCLSIYSPLDNVVFPMTTSALMQRGGTDHEAPASGHFSILFERSVLEATADYLAATELAPVPVEVVSKGSTALTADQAPSVVAPPSAETSDVA